MFPNLDSADDTSSVDIGTLDIANAEPEADTAVIKSDTVKTEVAADTSAEVAEVATAPVEDEKPVKKSKSAPPDSKFFRFGLRAACNNSYVPGLRVSIQSVDMSQGGEVVTAKYKNELGPGFGFEAGGQIGVRIAGQLSLITGASFIYRRPVVTDGFDISEMAVGVPVLLRYTVYGPLYAEAGGQFGVPFGVKRNWKDGESEDFEHRADLDAGAVIGVGFNITNNIAVDMRGVAGLLPFDADERDKPVYLFSVGVSFMY